jgi:hypothetical protein
MTRYYFHIRDHDRLILDEEGVEIADDDGAQREAEASADDLVQDAITSGDDIGHQVIEVATEDGRVIATIALRDRTTRGHH